MSLSTIKFLARYIAFGNTHQPVIVYKSAGLFPFNSGEIDDKWADS
jgi:hypothetical protein